MWDTVQLNEIKVGDTYSYRALNEYTDIGTVKRVLKCGDGMTCTKILTTGGLFDLEPIGNYFSVIQGGTTKGTLVKNFTYGGSRKSHRKSHRKGNRKGNRKGHRKTRRSSRRN
jgi:hypothetical protein